MYEYLAQGYLLVVFLELCDVDIEFPTQFFFIGDDELFAEFFSHGVQRSPFIIFTTHSYNIFIIRESQN